MNRYKIYFGNTIHIIMATASQNRVFLTFGGPTEGYRNRSKIIAEQSKKLDYFTESVSLTDDFLKSMPEFWEKHGKFMEENSRGYGYWLWKPYIIKTYLDKLQDGDILVYADAGCYINPNGRNRFLEYIHMLDTDTNGYGILSFQLYHPEIRFTKRALMDIMKADQEMALSGQCMATVVIIKKNSHSTMVINKWWGLANQYNLINDSRTNLLGHSQPEHPLFIDHRHDQSIYSLIVKKYGSIKIPDETWFHPNWVADGTNFPIWATRIRS